MAVEATFDVLIVGAGACGATSAYFLSGEGLKTGLLDQGRAGREASWASAGMIGPRSSPPRDPWFLQATTTSRQLYDRLAVELPEQTGASFGYGGEGALLLARTGAELDLLDAAAWPPHPAVPQRRLDAREAREREPALPGDVTGAMWCPEDRFLDARRYTATVLQAAVLRGVDLLEGVRVTGLEWDGDRVIGVRSADRCWHAGTVINTAGAWAGGIDPRLTHPVYPDHGQIMALQGPPRGLRHNLSRVGAEGYATPRPDGRVIFGATHELWGYQKKITADGFAFLAATVDELLPALRDAPVLEIWSGLRPGTPDGLPTVGPDPRVRGGYLWGAGHASSGMQQMPATAQVLTDLALQRPPRLPIHQLAIQRYLAT